MGSASASSPTMTSCPISSRKSCPASSAWACGKAEIAQTTSSSTRLPDAVWEAELYRRRGELLPQSGGMHSGVLAASGHGSSAEAEAAFQQALATARRQQAKSLELRAALSLSRLWQHQGKRTEAHELLATIYG